MLGTVSTASGVLSTVGTGAGFIKGIKDLFAKESYDVQKAVQLSGTVGWETKEKAIALAIFANNAMDEMLNKQQVTFNKDKTQLVWNDAEVKKAYYDAIWAIKCKN